MEPNKLGGVSKLLGLLSDAEKDFDQDCVAMDCNDLSEDMAVLAERVANGERLEDISPVYADHLRQVQCCREEFDALVAVLRIDRESSASE